MDTFTFWWSRSSIEELLRYWNEIIVGNFNYVPSIIFILIVRIGIGRGHIKK
jgi:hypothetical protein